MFTLKSQKEQRSSIANEISCIKQIKIWGDLSKPKIERVKANSNVHIEH